MNKKLNFWLMVALMCSLAVSVTSCKDDDKNDHQSGGQSGGETDGETDKDMADAAVFWDVVGKLSDTPMPDDWRNATYQPAIGQPDGTNSAIRIVNCADAETAAERAADLLGANITTETAEYTYENDIVGKLTYHKTGGSSLAIVDVSIQQMPGLSQIVYKTSEQMGDNASFKGTAYYRFGDVVSKVNADGKTDFWICVRPAFGPAGKGDSHWISLSKLPNANKKNPASKVIGGVKLLMPTSLSTSNEHMQNLAEMLYAMTHPTEWDENLWKDKGYKKLKYFGDFTFEKRYKFFNNDVFEYVAEGWESMGLFEEIFGLTKQELSRHLEQKGLSLVTGNSTQSGNSITLPIVRFEGTNLKTRKDFKATSSWTNTAFNIDSLTKKGYIDEPIIVGANTSDRYWVCRYATGATLAQGNEAGGFDVHKKLPNCTDFFVYNQAVDHLDMTRLKDLGPYEGGYIGRPHYMPCDIYKDEKGNRWFVSLPSGLKKKTHAGNVGVDADPYTYLYSFEGITYTSDKKRATNLPDRDEAIRAMLVMESMSKQVTALAPTINEMHERAEGMLTSYWKCVDNLYGGPKINLGIFLPSFWLGVFPKSGVRDYAVWLASVAYNDDSDPDQKLLRYIENPDRYDRQPEFFVWQHYPSVPSDTLWYPEKFDSGISIYLKDIANADWVGRYAEDPYACSIIHKMSGGDNQTKGQIRSTTDSRATNVTNYFWKKDVWNNRTYPTDMWNAPIAFMRVTRVYDRGDAEYSKKTVDGHTLTLVQHCPVYDQWDGVDPEYDPFEPWRQVFLMQYSESLDDLHIDGKKYRLPSWRDSYYGK